MPFLEPENIHDSEGTCGFPHNVVPSDIAEAGAVLEGKVDRQEPEDFGG